jgi:hypothetical protein
MARLSLACRAEGVPLLNYQHGGRTGTQRIVQDEIDFGRCDRELVYGEGIHPRSHVLGASVPEFVPVGSTRVERMRARRRPGPLDGEAVRVLVLGESSYGNTVGATFCVEDTERYRLERDVIDALASSPRIEVTYRPYPFDPEATAVPAWIARERGEVAVARAGPRDDWSLDALLAATDVAVTALSCETVWNQALAVGLPLVVYCDPRQTPLVDDFMQTLDQACLWARTPDEFVALARRFAVDPDAVLADLRTRDPARYLELHVLHRDDGKCVDRALAEIADARRTSS